MSVRRLSTEDAGAYRALMLTAYRLSPESFASTEGERATLPLSWWQDRVAHPRGASIGFGAFVDEALVGAVVLEFETRQKIAHKASLIGMYVEERMRGRGLGRALVAEALACARARPETIVVQLTLTDGNVPALRLYQSFGFVPFGLEPLAFRFESGYRARVHLWCDLRSRER